MIEVLFNVYTTYIDDGFPAIQRELYCISREQLIDVFRDKLKRMTDGGCPKPPMDELMDAITDWARKAKLGDTFETNAQLFLILATFKPN